MTNIKREGHFTTVTNEFIRSTEISFKAKGVFVYMASFDSSWNFTLRSMDTQSLDGRRAITNAIDELKELGYIEYIKHPNGSGTYHLYDNPKSHNAPKPKSHNATMAKRERIKKNNITKKNNTYTLFLEDLKSKVSIKSKVTKTKEGEAVFKSIENKKQLAIDYIAHQIDKKEFAQRITAYMLDYTPQQITSSNGDWLDNFK